VKCIVRAGLADLIIAGIWAVTLTICAFARQWEQTFFALAVVVAQLRLALNGSEASK
jgi:hypothetical protein